MPPPAKQYDQRYFDKWYRHPRHRIASAAELKRKVSLVVSLTEVILERPIRSMLDVGCGEGRWQPVLARLRPRARYLGIDPSPYVVRRFGRRRNIRLGRFEQLEAAGLDHRYDLIVCSDVLHYVNRRQMVRGLSSLVALMDGLACLEVFTSADDIEGDRQGFRRRSASAYRTIFREAGLVPCGMQCYVRKEDAAWLDALALL